MVFREICLLMVQARHISISARVLIRGKAPRSRHLMHNRVISLGTRSTLTVTMPSWEVEVVRGLMFSGERNLTWGRMAPKLQCLTPSRLYTSLAVPLALVETT